MIFTGFKRKTNQFFFKKRLNNRNDDAIIVSNGTAENLLVILDDPKDKLATVNKLSQITAIKKSEITVLTFQKTIMNEKELHEYSFCPADFGWYGKIKSDMLRDILTKKYDLLINYSKVENLYSNLLILQSKTAFKVGFSYQNNELYELMIDCKSGDYGTFNAELEKYLTILNKIECKNY